MKPIRVSLVLLSAFPQENGCSASEKHVQNIFNFVGYLEAVAFADHHMPGRPKFFIQSFLYHSGSTLSNIKYT